MSTLSEIERLELGNEHGGKQSFQSRFVVPVAIDPQRLAKRIGDIRSNGASFFELKPVSVDDEEGYTGRLTQPFMSRIKGLLATKNGPLAVPTVRAEYLEPFQDFTFDPENLGQPHIARLSAVEFFPFTHGAGFLVVTVRPPTAVRQGQKYVRPSRWPIRTLVDLNYYLSRLSVSKRPSRNPSLLVNGCGKEQRRLTMHRLVSVCSREILEGGHKWKEIWGAEEASGNVAIQKRAVVYTHACVVPTKALGDSNWSLCGADAIRGLESLLLNLSQYREKSLKKPSRHEAWRIGRDAACRIHGYTPRHIIGTLLNGRSVFDSTRYPHIFQESNFFGFLLAFSMRTIYDQVQSGTTIADPWIELARVFRPFEVTEEPVRAEFLARCMAFFGLRHDFMETPGVADFCDPSHEARSQLIRPQAEYDALRKRTLAKDREVQNHISNLQSELEVLRAGRDQDQETTAKRESALTSRIDELRHQSDSFKSALEEAERRLQEQENKLGALEAQTPASTSGSEDASRFNYRLHVDVDRRTAIIQKRPVDGKSYQTVFQARDNGYFHLLASLAALSKSMTSEIKHLPLNEVLQIYESGYIPEGGCSQLDEVGLKKARTRVDSLRRVLRRKGVDPDRIIASKRGEGVVLQPAVNVEFPKRGALSGAISDSDVDAEGGQVSASDRESARDWLAGGEDDFYSGIDE